MPQGKPGQPGHSRREGGEVVPLENLLGNAGYNDYSVYRVTFADGCTTHKATRFRLAQAVANAEDAIVYDPKLGPEDQPRMYEIHGTAIEAKRIRQPIPLRLR